MMDLSVLKNGGKSSLELDYLLRAYAPLAVVICILESKVTRHPPWHSSHVPK